MASILEVEDDTQDLDSALGDDDSYMGTSLDASIRNHVWEGGRRYHAYGAATYLIPNDEIELHREDMKDEMTRLMLHDRLHFAEFTREPRDAIDLGTGTGTWAMDFADQYPSCSVLGVDLSPVQPRLTPPNCEFQVDDIESDWLYSPESFDYIHIRYMAPAVKDWPKLLERCYRTLRPGGTIELMELDHCYTSDDGTVVPENPLCIFINHLNTAFNTHGPIYQVAPQLTSMLSQAEFANIRCEAPKAPFGWWPKDPRLKEVGKLMYAQFINGLTGIANRAFCTVLGWKREDVDELVSRVMDASRDQKNHGYLRLYCISAQKP